MTNYVNGGVFDATTKAALKRDCAADPTKVIFYGTSPMGRQWGGAVAGMPEDVTLSVTGPDPYKDRRWYASVTRKGDKVKVT